MSWKDIPSPAQAKKIANIWSDWQPTKIGTNGYIDSTNKSLIRRGWIVGTGQFGEFTSGHSFEIFEASDDGLDALASYLLQKRYERMSK